MVAEMAFNHHTPCGDRNGFQLPQLGLFNCHHFQLPQLSITTKKFVAKFLVATNFPLPKFWSPQIFQLLVDFFGHHNFCCCQSFSHQNFCCCHKFQSLVDLFNHLFRSPQIIFLMT
jgi:hypothetical protein